MQLLTNLFLLAHQLRTISGLRVIENGLGPPVFGAEETNVDFASLALDQKASLPSQVEAFCFWCSRIIDILTFEQPFSVHDLRVCNLGCFVNRRRILPTSLLARESLGYLLFAPSTRKPGSHFQIYGKIWHLREAINSEEKKLWNNFGNGGGGGLTDFIPLFYFSKHPSNTLQTPCNTLQTPLKHPSTLQTTFKIIYFFRSKNGRKKINRDFIKGGRGGGPPFYEVISQKIFFFTNEGFPKWGSLPEYHLLAASLCCDFPVFPTPPPHYFTK